MQVWVNGRLLSDPDEPVLRVSDHGFTVGDGVFEAVKVVDGRPFALSRHLRRLSGSAAGLHLPAPDHDLIREAVAAVLAPEHIALGRLRVTWTAGPSPLGSGRQSAHSEPTLVVAAVGMAAYPPAAQVVTVPWPRNERGAVAGLKTTSYAENVVALAEAARRGAGEAVFANTAGMVCEGTGSNLFYVLDGTLVTPTLASGCLAGISRELLLEWFPAAEEVDAPISELARTQEAFLVSTTRDVQPIDLIDDRVLAAPGPHTVAAMAAWRAGEARGIDP